MYLEGSLSLLLLTLSCMEFVESVEFHELHGLSEIMNKISTQAYTQYVAEKYIINMLYINFKFLH